MATVEAVRRWLGESGGKEGCRNSCCLIRGPDSMVVSIIEMWKTGGGGSVDDERGRQWGIKNLVWDMLILRSIRHPSGNVN